VVALAANCTHIQLIFVLIWPFHSNPPSTEFRPLRVIEIHTSLYWTYESQIPRLFWKASVTQSNQRRSPFRRRSKNSQSQMRQWPDLSTGSSCVQPGQRGNHRSTNGWLAGVVVEGAADCRPTSCNNRKDPFTSTVNTSTTTPYR
jgi:hypothetical protein